MAHVALPDTKSGVSIGMTSHGQADRCGLHSQDLEIVPPAMYRSARHDTAETKFVGSVD